MNIADEEETKKRFDRLLTILKHKAIQPNFITLARSVRDGFTVRDQQKDLEHRLQDILHIAFPRKTFADNVYYDDNLLGGPIGWSTRNRIQ